MQSEQMVGRERSNWTSPDAANWCNCTDTHSFGGPMPVKEGPSEPYGIAADCAVPVLIAAAFAEFVVAGAEPLRHSEWQRVWQISGR